jgi:hypothetical protein
MVREENRSASRNPAQAPGLVLKWHGLKPQLVIDKGSMGST